MTYFDFMDFEPVKFISNNTRVTLGQKLNASPVYIEAPGFSKEDISAEIIGRDLLRITGQSDNYGSREFEQSVFIPENVDTESIEVKVGNGMIAITFEDKREETKKIKVK